MFPMNDRKREKNPKFISGLKNLKGKKYIRPQSPERHVELLDTVRMQMQISEAMDAFAKRRLVQFASVKAWGQINVPEISLGLLNGTFRSDFPNERSYNQWKSRQANILEEYFSVGTDKNERRMIQVSLGKIRNSQEWDKKLSPSERSEILFSLRQSLSVLASRPGRFSLRGETYFWSSCYHLNVRLYEKLLSGLFDILEDGQLLEDTEELLLIMKLTWALLGITPTVHCALYGWVLFKQFVRTEEAILLKTAIREIRKVISSDVNDGREDEYLSSLICSVAYGGAEIKLNLVHSVLLSISSWCDSKLQDYHLHFSQKPLIFKGVMTMALLGTYELDASSKFKLIRSDESGEVASRKVRAYVEKSAEAACKRVTDEIYMGTEGHKSHPLALIATKLKVNAEKELSDYFPVLRHWYPAAARVASLRIHIFYGERLMPYLRNVVSLSEEVREVLSAANALENCLYELYFAAGQENGSSLLSSDGFVHYQIGEISRPIILDWIIAQHARIMEWTGRAFDLEAWEPLSIQQKQAASAVEVFRIIEETVDQLYELKLPIDITHLQALLSIVFHTLDAYLRKIASRLVDRKYLYPPVPPLTRYKEATFPVIKKKLMESTLLDNEVNVKLKELTTTKLCIKLNTLQYIQKQIYVLEEGIKKSWASARPSEGHEHPKDNYEGASGRILDTCVESVDELFAATFDCIRDTASHTIRSICEFIGTKVVFLDLRESFLFRLFRGGVDGARLDSMLPHLDTALNQVCGLIDNTLRDRVVSSIFRASLEGYVWVLLDGGPLCAYSDLDISMMEDDLNMLKDLFVADGEGLPRSLVEEEAKFAHQVLTLFSLPAESVIQMLLSSSEQISPDVETQKYGQRSLGEADTLIRVLCHKKDSEASKFLKLHYQLPASCEYDDGQTEEPSSRSPLVSDLLRRTASSRWEMGNNSFKSLKKKLQDQRWL